MLLNMGDAPKSTFACVDVKDMLQNDQTDCNTIKFLGGNVLVAEAKKNLQNNEPKVAMLRKSTIGVHHKSKRPARISVRKARLEGCRIKSKSGIERKVRTLKRLIPSKTASTGLEGILKETADYISSLQVRVRAMQFMVDYLTCSANDDH